MWQFQQMSAQRLDRLAAAWSDVAGEVAGPHARESRTKGLTLQARVHSRAEYVLQIVTAASPSLDRCLPLWHDVAGGFRFGAGSDGSTVAKDTQAAAAQSVKETR